MDGPLIVLRVAHFAATAVTAGALAFLVIVAAPTFRAASMQEGAEAFAQRCLRIVRIGLAAIVLSGVLWVALVVAAMSDLPLLEAVREGMVSIVLTQTQFGIVSDVRLGLAALLAGSLAFAGSSDVARWISLAWAAALLGSLGWTGHAAGTVGAQGALHLAGDALHVLAAGAWIGGLVPLALLLASVRHHDDDRWVLIAHHATRRFSMLGIASVGTLIVTGLLNAWILVGSFRALTVTDYGRLLLVKLGLFVAMLGLAAVNRLRLTPLLAQAPAQAAALRRLTRNSMVEIALGLIIFGIVGVLGAIHPAIHRVPP